MRINIPVTTPSRTVLAIRELLFDDMLSQSRKAQDVSVGIADGMVCFPALCAEWVLTGKALLLQELEHAGFCEDFEEI